jgi:hypothetical protein
MWLPNSELLTDFAGVKRARIVGTGVGRLHNRLPQGRDLMSPHTSSPNTSNRGTVGKHPAGREAADLWTSKRSVEDIGVVQRVAPTALLDLFTTAEPARDDQRLGRGCPNRGQEHPLRRRHR